MKISIQDRDKSLSTAKIDYLTGKLEHLEHYKNIATVDVKVSTHHKTEHYNHYDIHAQAFSEHGGHHYHAKEEGGDFFEIAEKVVSALNNQIQKHLK
jgi:ribosomal subunit interface protein